MMLSFDYFEYAWNTPDHLLVQCATFVMTLTALLFFLSLVHQNTSWVDPVWSIEPLLIAIYFFLYKTQPYFTLRHILMFFGIALYSLRLTINWYLRLGHRMFFGGAMVDDKDEDWRFTMLREKVGKKGSWAQWLWWWGFGSPILIHVYQTVSVFLACIPIYFAIVIDPQDAIVADVNPYNDSFFFKDRFGLGVNIMDGIAFGVCIYAVILEAMGDLQLDVFLAQQQKEREGKSAVGNTASSSNSSSGSAGTSSTSTTGKTPRRRSVVKGADVNSDAITSNSSNATKAMSASADDKPTLRVCDIGLWSYSRHPNYLGEQLFWVALYLFGVAAVPSTASITWVGLAQIICLFLFASIPMMEQRQLERRGDLYRAYQQRVPMLIPTRWIPFKTYFGSQAGTSDKGKAE